MHKLLSKIFQSGKNRVQFVLAGGGFLIGMLLLLISLQLYLQIQAFLYERGQYAEYIILSKKVNMRNTLFMSRATFSPKEIKQLRAQPFVDQVGVFLSNQYEVTAYARGAVPFMSELFFEAVPDSLLDVQPEEWGWEEGDDFLPVILSKDMLNLYNFGYALGKGLPQLSPSSMGMLEIQVRVSGPGGRRNFKSRIVGFSERISSILVPRSFMLWANQNIGTGEQQNTSRLIIKVSNPQDPTLAQYLEQKNYQVNQDRLNASRAGAVIQIAMSIIGTIGLFFMILSLIIFSSNFRIILAEAKEEIRLLTQLGYTLSTLARFLIGYFSIFLALLLVLSLFGLYFGVGYLQDFMQERGFSTQTGIYPTVWVVALVFTGLTWLTNTLAVVSLIKKYT